MQKISLEGDIISLLSKEQIEQLKQTYLTPKVIKIFEDEDLIHYCEEFFNCNLNVSLAAEKIYMHRNTLSYKINKIKKQTGLDIKNFNDAFVFKVLINIYSKRV